MHHTGGGAATDAFNPDNGACRRFTTMTIEHLDVIGWTREDGRPVMVSLVDLDSGDTVTLAVIDSLEDCDPHALLTITADGAMVAYGPFAGGQTAAGHAPRLAAADPSVIATCTAALHPADDPALPDRAWRPTPDEIAAGAHPAGGDSGATVVALLNRTRAVCAIVGPFENHAAADAWRPTQHIDRSVDRLVIGLQTPPPPDPAR
jgi:hypothetical protein